MSNYNAFHIRDCTLSFALKYLPVRVIPYALTSPILLNALILLSKDSPVSNPGIREGPFSSEVLGTASAWMGVV